MKATLTKQQLANKIQKITDAQNQKMVKNHFSNSTKNFVSIFDDFTTDEIWKPVEVSIYTKSMNNYELIAQEVFSERDNELKEWKKYLFQLIKNELYKIKLKDKHEEIDENGVEICKLQKCFLKKINYQEVGMAQGRFGFRLNFRSQKYEFFADGVEQYNKWFDYLKRMCILQKFTKKYRLLNRVRITNNSIGVQQIICYNIINNLQQTTKIYDKNVMSDAQQSSLVREITILRMLDHTQVQHLQELYEDESYVYIIFELNQGIDLKQKMEDIMFMDEQRIAEIFYKLIKGLAHIHSKLIIHRDIRLENLIFHTIQNIMEPCICNFQQSVLQDEIQSLKSSMSSSQNGNSQDIPNSTGLNQNTDIFNLGVAFYNLLFGKNPFETKTKKKQEIDYSQAPTGKKISSSVIDLLRQMLKPDPKQRISAQMALNHHWFINFKSKDNKFRSQIYIKKLSTIWENSDIVDASYLSGQSMKSRQNSRNKSQSFTSNSQIKIIRRMSMDMIIEDEFSEIQSTLQYKMQLLNSMTPQKKPSRYNHIVKQNEGK